MKIDQNSSDVVVFPRSGYETGSSILHALVPSEKMIGIAVQQAVSSIKAKRHVGPRYEP